MRKRILSILLCLVMVVGLFPTMAFAADGSGATTGSGTKSDPYCVSTYAEMKRLLQTQASYYIKVVGMDNDVKVEGVPARLLDAGRDFKSTEPAIDIPSGANHHLEIATKIWFVTKEQDGDENIFGRLIDVEHGSSLEITGTGSLRVEVNTLVASNAIIRNGGGVLTIDGSVVLSGIQNFTSNVATRPIFINGGVTNIKGGYIYGHNNMTATSNDVTSAIHFGETLAEGTALNISGGTIRQFNNETNQENENSCALYVDNDKVANAIHLTGGTFEGGMKMKTGKPLSDLLTAGYQFNDMSTNTVFDGSVSKTQKALVVTPAGVDTTIINDVSLTVKKSPNERVTLSDFDCSYSQNDKMVLDNFGVYPGLNSTSKEIKDHNTPYDSSADYTVMYVFKKKDGFSFSRDVENHVTVSGGEFLKADQMGGKKGLLRVFVNFPGNTPIDSVTLDVPKLKEGDKSGGNFTLSGTNTGVSTINTVWEGIPTTGTVAGNFYAARITLTAEDGYAFSTNTQVKLNGDYLSTGSGIKNGGKGMIVYVNVLVRHEHKYGAWQIAGTGNVHFRECSCGVREEKPHEWEYLEGQDKYKCTVCGYEIDGEKERITYVYASPRSPIAGEHPGDYAPAEWVKIGGANYKVESIVWKNMDDTDVTTFEAGKIYKGTVTFKADTGFAFDGDRIYSDKIFNSSNAEVVGNYTLADGGTTLTATFQLKDANVVKPGLNVKVKLPTLNDKIGQSLPAADLVGTTLPENVALVYSVYKDNLLGEEITDPNYKVKSNQKYLYVVWLKVGDSTDITEITKKYNVSYEVADGGDAETHANLAEYGVLAMYQTPDASATSKINSVALTVTAPKYGDTPATTATGANDTLYTVGTPTWSPAVTDGKFGAAAYTVFIPVTAKSGYSFDANCLYTVNGYLATYADGKVSYTFPALTAPHEHSYGTDWKYDDTNHWHECECGDKANIAAHSASEWIVDTAATETADGAKHKECTVCKKVLETATIPATHSHSYNQETVKPEALKTPADCTSNAVYFKSCSCGAISTTDTFVAMNTALGHAYGSDWKYDSTNHWHECSRCHDKKDEAAHDYGSDNVCDTCGYDKTVPHTHNLTLVAAKAATCTTAGNSAYYTCDGCDKWFEDATGSVEITDKTSVKIPAPGHTAGTEWKSDDTNHWHECTVAGCGVIIESTKSAHTAGEWIVDTPATATTAGTKHKECTVCKKVIETATIPATGSGSTGGGGGGSSVTTYAITVKSAKNGDVTASRKSASKGTTVTLTVDPDKGYVLDTLTVLDGKDKEIKLTEKNGKFTFTMPASKVTVEAMFKAAGNNPFIDVPAGSYYEDAVIWAVDKGITSGTSATTFNPNGNCTRAQAVTFLWRAAGSPAPKTKVMPFTDVPSGSYYYDAVLWAVEQGITKGSSETKFSPDATCTRAQIVTFLWRANGSPVASGNSAFTDVASDAYYAAAVTWAEKNGVTGGIGGGLFGSNNNCTRAQIVTFIYRSVK